MAKNNPGDILTSDFNPLVGCQRYSAGCRDCWFIFFVLPWQKRLGNLPETLIEGTPLVIAERLKPEKLSGKKGIVGVIQHGDLFWDKVSDETIHRILDIVDHVADETKKKNVARAAKGKPLDQTKYVLWSKRAKRMADFMSSRYPDGVPPYLACGVSVEDQRLADERLPHLLRIKGHRFVMIEPMLGPINVKAFTDVSWMVVGSETGTERARPMELDWARAVRDVAVSHKIPFFLKQVGSSHKKPNRELDGRSWDQFPTGFVK
jgi:protein gp37